MWAAVFLQTKKKKVSPELFWSSSTLVKWRKARSGFLLGETDDSGKTQDCQETHQWVPWGPQAHVPDHRFSTEKQWLSVKVSNLLKEVLISLQFNSAVFGQVVTTLPLSYLLITLYSFFDFFPL